jgi:hypothetical protein
MKQEKIIGKGMNWPSRRVEEYWRREMRDRVVL